MGEIKLKIASVVIGSGEGGGSGVAPYYADLPDKPSINGETLSGDMTSEDLGLASKLQAVPSGGKTGQVLAKKSNADNDLQWVNQESGGQGTTDYAGLDNKPLINSVILSGNKSASDLGIATAAQGELAVSAYQKPQTGIPSTDLASGVQTSLGKADTAVQSITVGTTTTGAAGTNASVTNSGTATNPVLDFTIPRGEDGQDGADAYNPFKGWYASSSALPSNPIVGDYAYVKGASSTGPAAIYECNTAGTWSDSGMTVDTSNVQTFASSEEVNQTWIDNTHLVNPKDGALPTAADVMQLKAKLEGITSSMVKVNVTPANGYVSGSNGSIAQYTGMKYIETPIGDAKHVRFLGVKVVSSTSTGYAFGHYTDESDPTTWVTDKSAVFDSGASSATEKEYESDVPDNATHFRTTSALSAVSSLAQNFYCYMYSGKNVSELLEDKLEVDKVTYADYSQFIVWDSRHCIRETDATLQSSSYGNAGYTEFIPVDSVKGLYCSNPFSKGSGSTVFAGGFVYNSNKEMIRQIGFVTSANTSKWYIKQEGDAYVRFNIGEGAEITELTSDIIVTPSDISNYEAYKISEGAVVAGQKIFAKTTGKNLCNPDKITVQTGLYIAYSSGAVSYSASNKTTKGITDFIKMEGETVRCNHAVTSGSMGYAVYDENYQYIRGGQSSTVSYQEGDCYVRFSLNDTSEIQVEYGTISTEYEPYVEKIIFNDDLIPEKTENIKTYDQGVDIVLPSNIYCTKGDTLYLYWRSFIEAVNPKVFDCCSPNSATTNNVLSYPDCLKITRTSDTPFNVVVRDNALNEVAKKTVNYKAVNVPTSPASAVNVLLVGASREANGVTPLEVYRRLVGDNTMSPAGLGLTNISFIGRKGCKAYDCEQLGYPSSLYSQVKHEAVSGKKIHDMVVAGDLTGYTFYYEPNPDYVFNQGDKYTDGTRVYTVVGSDPADGDLQVSISSGSGTPSATGTLTLTDGSGTASVAYTSYENETSNPFWNSSTGKIDFAKYSTDYCNGATISVLVLCRVMNDLYNGMTPSQIAADYKTVIDAFHEYNANGYVIINLSVLPSIYGGLPHSYTNGKPLSTAWYTARINLEIHKLLIALGESDDYKDFCLLSNSNAEFDLDYYYSKEATTIRNRGASKTVNYDNNGLHFNATGKQVVADSIYHCVCKIINDING